MKAWNKGLTKQTDERVKKNAESKILIKRPGVVIRNKLNNPMKNLKSRKKLPKTFEFRNKTATIIKPGRDNRNFIKYRNI